MIQYSTLDEMLEPHAISNPIIASYITAYVSPRKRQKNNIDYDVYFLGTFGVIERIRKIRFGLPLLGYGFDIPRFEAGMANVGRRTFFRTI